MTERDLAPNVGRDVLLAGIDLEREYRTGPEMVRVLRGASVEIRPGEVVALVGASGVGKSTLLHLLGALDRPTAGRVLFQGEDLFTRSEPSLARYRRQEVGFVFQFHHLMPEFTALENVCLPEYIQNRSRAQARSEATALLEEVGLGRRLHHKPGELSGGEQQRVAVARALMNGPKIILADEPTGNLDPKTSAVIYDLFLQLQAERGIAFFIATHNPDLARKADRIYRLVEGRAREVDPSER
jgi:lipoprotein-releasing system ATP-binding protein